MAVVSLTKKRFFVAIMAFSRMLALSLSMYSCGSLQMAT